MSVRRDSGDKPKHSGSGGRGEVMKEMVSKITPSVERKLLEFANYKPIKPLTVLQAAKKIEYFSQKTGANVRPNKTK